MRELLRAKRHLVVQLLKLAPFVGDVKPFLAEVPSQVQKVGSDHGGRPVVRVGMTVHVMHGVRVMGHQRNGTRAGGGTTAASLRRRTGVVMRGHLEPREERDQWD